MTGTMTFKCNGGEINVSAKLEHVSMLDQAHLVMLMFDSFDLDMSKDMDEIAKLLAIASIMKAAGITEGSKIDMSNILDIIAKKDEEEAE